ncbi:MAG: hypothetical protein GX235_08900 [Clostridiales bacterium]|nr:hypothetical protein [Clostridiales bacterium]
MNRLIDNMNLLAQHYGKQIVVAEVAQPFTMEDYASYEKLAPQERKGAAAKPALEMNLEYPATKEGQALFMKKLIEEISSIANGLGAAYFYWEPAWLPVKGSGWANDTDVFFYFFILLFHCVRTPDIVCSIILFIISFVS